MQNSAHKKQQINQNRALGAKKRDIERRRGDTIGRVSLVYVVTLGSMHCVVYFLS